VLIYHSDEKAGMEIATLFFEKGMENCYLISGGLDNFALFYYDLLEGKELPPRRVPPP
jgi:centrosomal protein CEP41